MAAPTSSHLRRLAGAMAAATCAVAIGVAAGLIAQPGSPIRPAAGTLPATLDEAYAELTQRPEAALPSSGAEGAGAGTPAVDPADLSAPTLLYLSSFDPARERPVAPTAPQLPHPAPGAVDPYPMPDLTMPTRPDAATSCQAIVAAVGGPTARCAPAGDSELETGKPTDVPAGSYVVGRAYGDGHMVLLDQPGQGQVMWDAAMHERAHLLAAWLCGRADCLNEALVGRGYHDSRSYLASLTEGFAQSWAQCHGAEQRSDYVSITCADVSAVVDQAATAKRTAKDDYRRRQAAYEQQEARYEEDVRTYDARMTQVRVVTDYLKRHVTRAA